MEAHGPVRPVELPHVKVVAHVLTRAGITLDLKGPAEPRRLARATVLLVAAAVRLAGIVREASQKARRPHRRLYCVHSL